MFFVVTQDFTSNEVDQDLLAQHVAFMMKIQGEGQVCASGPFLDERKGGMFILKAESEADAKELVESDPAVKGGMLKNEIRNYQLSFIQS